MNVKLLVIEDTRVAVETVLSVAGAEFGLSRGDDTFVVDASMSGLMSTPTSPEEADRAFRKLSKQIAAASGPAIAVVDFSLGCSERLRGKLRAELTKCATRPPEQRIFGQIDGLSLCFAAMKNRSLSPLMIVVATSLGSTVQLHEYLRTLISSSGRDNDVRILSLNQLTPILSGLSDLVQVASLRGETPDHLAGGILDVVVKAWADWQHPPDGSPTRISQLTAREWRDLRQNARLLCCQLCREFSLLNHAGWLHHCADGGNPTRDAAAARAHVDALQRLQGALAQKHTFVSTLPLSSWTIKEQDAGAGAEMTWDKVPVRALGQFTSAGNDIDTVLWLLELSSRRLSQSANNLDVALTFSNQLTAVANWSGTPYLWFNAPALCEGLWQLAHDFFKLAAGTGKTVSNGFEAQVRWDFSCATGDDEIMRAIVTVVQTVVKVASGHVETFRFDLPLPGKAEPKAYSFLRNAGGVLHIENGMLSCSLTGTNVKLDRQDYNGIQTIGQVCPVEGKNEEER